MRIKLGKFLAVVLAACMTLSSVSLSALMDPDKLPANGGELANYSYTLTEDIDLTGGYIVTHNVTIDLNGHTIKNVMEKTRVKDGDLTMFTVRNGATLTINDSSADNSGTLDQNSKNDRTIRVDGNGYMDSSTNQWVNGAASSLTINGGQFVNSTDGAVYSNNGGNTVTLNGGTLKDNTTPGNGGAICVDGGGTFIMNGGTVDNNKSLRDANEDWGKIGGGGIYVLGNMTMSGGTVSNNTAGAGGGIFVNANWHDHGAPCDYIFKMSGGTVTGNVANKIEGGGIRIGWFVDAVFETDPGKIILIADNHTSSKTDWGGGGIFVSEDGKATMYDTLITGNTADGFGGGLTGCPTAHNYVMSTDGAAIYGNTAKGVQGVTDSTKADSEAFESDVFKKGGNYQDYYCNLKSIISDTMLGGGSERWIGSIDFKSVEIGPGETRVSSETSGLTARPSDADKARAERLATIIIRDNTSATHGGGILNNGMLFFGERPDEGKGYVPTYFSIPVKKSITGAKNLTINDRFKFELKLTGVVLKNTANNQVEKPGEKDYLNTVSTVEDTVTVVGAAEGRFKSIQFTDPDEELKVGESGYSDKYLTYTFEVREVEYQPAEGEPENQYEYTLDTTVWRVEADVIAEAIGDPDIESMFNVNRYLTVREIRLYENDGKEPVDTVTNATHNGGTITADKGFIASFNNTLGTGDLKVEKKTVIKNENDVVDNYETDETFTFTVTLEPALNGTFGDMKFKDGEATFELGNGEHKTAAGLPIGVHYTVTEGDNDKYESSLSANSVGTIDEETLDDETNTVTVKATNTVKTGSLKITKTLKGAVDAAKGKTFSFTITGEGVTKNVTVEPGKTVEVKDLVPGEYTITETGAEVEGYTLTVTGIDDPVTVAADQVTEVNVTNDYTQKLGSLKITKTLAGEVDAASDKTFTFTVTGPDEFSKTVTINGEGEETLNDLVPGEYKITEQNADIEGYTLEVSGDTTAKVTAEEVANVTIVNTYTQDKGSLTVSKTVVGSAPGADTKEFDFTVTGPNDYSTTFKLKNGESKTLSDLVPGKYNITESNTGITGYSVVTSGVGDVTVEGKKETTVAVTNTYTQKPGSLKIVKSVEGGGEEAANKTFTFTVTGPDEFSKTVTIIGEGEAVLKDLVPGDYTVTEDKTSAQISGYTLTVDGEGKATVSAEDVANVTIVNTYTQKPGSLKIVKSVVGGGEEAANKTFTFTVTGTNYSKTVTIKGNGETKLDNLVPGEYKITETGAEVEGYTLTVTGIDDPVTVVADQVTEVNVTNDYTQKLGSLKIVKSVEGGGDEAANKTFTFTVTGTNYSKTVTITGNGYAELENLVPGEYTVTEDKTSAQISGYTLTVDGEGKATVSAEDVANVTIVNTYTQKPGSLKITKTLKGEVDAAKGKTFSFTITGEGVTKNVTVEPGKTVEVKDLVPGTYTITETGAEVEGYTLTVTGIDDPVTVAADQVTEVNVTNTYTQKPGSLKIVKSVEGGGEEAANKTFTFTVTGPDGYNETVTIIGEGEETLNDLVPGEYTITEQDANIDGYTLEVTGNGETKTVTADQVAEFDITNTYTQKLGSLKIVKSVVGGGEEAANKTFTFTVTGTNYSKTVTITGTGEAVLENLVPGEYTVTENKTSAQINGYTLAVTGEGKATVSAEDVANVTIVNTYTQKPGSLKIVKSVVGGGDEAANKTFTFTITGPDEFSKTVTITGNGYAELENLVPGEYTVTEQDANIEGYTLEVTGNGETKTVTADQVAEFDITNTYTQKPGSLRIVKTLSGEVDAASDKTFTFTVTGPDGYNETVTVIGAGTVTLENLVPGTYTVTEDTASAEVEGYTLSVTGNGSTATIAADGNAEVTITNNYTRKAGDLSVTKTLAGPVTDEDMAGSYNITVTLTNADGSPYSGNYTLSGAEYEYSGPISLVFTGFTSDSKNKTIQISGLPVGTRYTVTETAVDETFNVSYTAVTGDGVVTAVSVSGSITETLSMATVTNTKKETERFALNVTKTVEGAVPAEPFKFNVTFYIKTAEGIAAPAGAVLGADGAGNVTYAFEIPANTTVSFTGVPKGTYYEITEAPAEGYTLINQSLTSGTLLGNAEAAFVNKENVRGSLSIVKELIGEGNALNAYNVNVTLTYPDERGVVSEVVTLTPGMPKIYEDLPVGTAFEVSETAESADGYNVSVSINGGGYVPGATATGTVTETAPVVSVAVRNEKEAPKESSLTVIKTVRGDNIDPTRAFNFTVTLTDTTINGVYGEMEFVNGVASFALAGGQSKSADKLPEGIGYTVKELDENLDGYTTEYPANATGILSSDSSAVVEVINTTSTLPGSLSVTKQVTGDGAEMGRTFMFTVMLNDPTITGQYGDMYFNGGVATIYLAHGMRATATGLPAGVGYNVIENDYGDYIPQAINPTGVIPDNGSAEVVYINHRDEQLGSLSVSKTVEGEGYDPEQEFTFTVTVNDPTVNGRYGDMFFSGGVATLTLKAGRTATATNLPADTGYTVTEAPVENYTSAATGDVGIIPAGNGAYAQFVNTYEAPKVGGFSLMKIVSGTAADPNRYFTFQVILSDATINGVYGDLAFADGFSTVFLRHGDIVYCGNLPEGTGYTVIELDADDYEVSCNAPAGTIVSGETGEIIFENHKDVPPPPPPEIPENEENPHGDDLNAGVGRDRDRHGDDMNAGVGMDDMNPATGDFMSESFMNGMAMLSAIVAAIAAFGAAVLIRKRKED